MTVVAFIGRTERGPVDRAVPVTSFDEYCRIFGGHTPLGFVSYAVQHFFLHGGENAVVVRLTNGATPGSIDVPAGDGLLRLVARRPGSREHLRVSVDYQGVEHSSDRFNLVVQRVAGPGSQLVEDQELYPALSLDPADPRFVVDALRESELVRLVGPLPSCRPDATPPKFPGEPFRYVDMSTAGTDGDELTDYDIVGSKDEGTGLFALDRVARIDILCVPAPPQRDFGTTALIAAERYCRRRRALLVWDPPSAWPTSDSAVIGMRSIGFASTNAMTYFPRLRPRGRFGDFPPGMPACGALAGLFASGDKERGHPGGPVGALKASFSTLCDLGEREATRLLRFGVNPLMRIAGGAVVLDGNVCLAPEDGRDAFARRLDFSRATLHVLDTLERVAQRSSDSLGEPGAADRYAQEVRAKLAELHASGVLAGRHQTEAYFVRIVASGPEAIVIRVGVAIAGPGCFRTYDLELGRTGLAVREVPPLDGEQLVG
ncbi:MAG: hypothetical protein LOD94_10550 [Gammaproteobacteria bacterium]|nr:hypothetical protein [Gammaproteobacteria bacterium]